MLIKWYVIEFVVRSYKLRTALVVLIALRSIALRSLQLRSYINESHVHSAFCSAKFITSQNSASQFNFIFTSKIKQCTAKL